MLWRGGHGCARRSPLIVTHDETCIHTLNQSGGHLKSNLVVAHEICVRVPEAR